MILGFAHVTRNEPHSPYSTGMGVASAQEKWPLMARRAESHRIALYKLGWGPLRLPAEIVQYDTGVVEGPSRIEVDEADCVIFLPARDRELEKRFYCEGLGFRQYGQDVESIRLECPVPGWHVMANVYEEAGAPVDPPLDIWGWAALAFYSSDIEADCDKARSAGGRTPTELFTVKLHREMKIVMLRSPEGTIIELIQVKGKA